VCILSIVIGVGNGCKQLGHFLTGCTKGYRVIGTLGVATDSFDATGNITDRADYSHITRAHIESLLPEFTGDIMQAPPAYSALKRNGVPLYKLARQGVDVKVELRPAHVKSLQCTMFEGPLFELQVVCSSGFYVRSLIHDIGQKLGCYAHITVLERNLQSEYTLSDAIPEQDWTQELLRKQCGISPDL
jgi:tRNA pseudouridine55 synthase